jgi:hypothetical protein
MYRDEIKLQMENVFIIVLEIDLLSNSRIMLRRSPVPKIDRLKLYLFTNGDRIGSIESSFSIILYGRDHINL